MKKPDSFFQVRAALKKGELTALEVVHTSLARIEEHNQHLNAFINVYSQEALRDAQRAQQNYNCKQARLLEGAVIGLKDVLCYQDHPVQAASRMLEGFISQFSGTAVERLLQAGGIVVGHQNCDEFGMGSSNENSVFGPARNPLDPSRVPGGSSGGSAAGVRAGMCHVALGSDTGGSVRQPAAFCGIVGLKPTYGRVSRHGLIAYASSFDTVGILAGCVEDCALALEAIAGSDAFDSTASQRPVPAYSKQLNAAGCVRIAYFKEAMEHPGLQAAVQQHTQNALDKFARQGHVVEAVAFPWLRYVLPTYHVLANAEASTNLARFDGIRYGRRGSDQTTLSALYRSTRAEGFGEEVKRRILMGTFVLSSAHYEAWYVQAQRVRRLIKMDLDKILQSFDFIVLPTTPTTAFALGEKTKDPLAMYLADLYTVIASVAGLPAISVPNGTDADGMPVGLQIIAGDFEEAKLLSFAHSCTQQPSVQM